MKRIALFACAICALLYCSAADVEPCGQKEKCLTVKLIRLLL